MSKKLTFIAGSILGSALGLLFAAESGKELRTRLAKASSPQKKFELMFQEYLKVGKDALEHIESSDVAHEIVQGGKEIVAELKKRAATEGTAAIHLAQQKANEIIAEAEKKIRVALPKMEKQLKKTAKKVSAQAVRTAKDMQHTASEQMTAAKKALVRKGKAVQKEVKKAVTKKAPAKVAAKKKPGRPKKATK